MPGKSLGPPSPFFKTKSQSHIKRILNKLGCKRETSERRNNPLDPESPPSSASHETALRHLLIFDIGGASTKIAAGDVLEFLGSGHTQKKCPFAVASANKFSLRSD
jgi:hypothetical protein